MKKQRILSLGLFFIFLGIVFLTIPVTYAINDDVAMRDIASGAMSGTPDYHLVFVKAALGMILSTLYTWGSGIDWYGLLWMGLIIWSMLLILWKLISFCSKKGKNPILTTLFFLVMFTMTVLEHLVNFQFTVVAGIVIGVAIFFYLTDESEGRKNYLVSTMIIIMIWLSYCVRANVLLMAVPFGGLLFLYKKDSIKKKVVMALIAVAGLVTIIGVEKLCYAGEEWQTYLEYNDYRSWVYDYYGVPAYAEHKAFYDEIGLQEHDVVNLERYNLYFIDELETEKMELVAKYAKNLYWEQHSLKTRIKSGIKCAIKGELQTENLVLNLLAKLMILLNLLWGFKNNKKGFWVNVGFLFSEGLLMLYLGYEGRLPARVGSAMFFIEFFAALAIFYENNLKVEESCNRKKWVSIFAMVFLVVLAGGKLAQIKGNQERIFNSNLQNEQLQEFCEEYSENIYFIPVLLTAGYTENFHIRQEAGVRNGFSLGGWTCFSPVKQQGLAYYGIVDVDKAIVEQENVLLILSKLSSRIEAHYSEKYSAITWTQVGNAPIFGIEVPVFKIAEGDSI